LTACSADNFKPRGSDCIQNAHHNFQNGGAVVERRHNDLKASDGGDCDRRRRFSYGWICPDARSGPKPPRLAASFYFLGRQSDIPSHVPMLRRIRDARRVPFGEIMTIQIFSFSVGAAD
jgi:hypothetical protein